MSSERDAVAALASMASVLGVDARQVRKAADQMEQPCVVTVAEAVARVLPTLREQTRDRWERALRKLVHRCGDRDIADVNTLELRTWTQEVMAESATDPRHRHGYGAAGAFVDACRHLFRQAVLAGWRWDDPTLALSAPPRPHNGRRALTESELKDCFDIALSTGRDPDLDGLILWFLRETACRRETLLTLTISQINLGMPSVRLTEKNRHTRELPISQALATVLVDHHESRHGSCHRVFHYRDGSCLTARRLDTLFGRIRSHHAWAQELGVSAHWFRHTTLTEIERTAGGAIAAAYAGHTARTTTGIYTKADFDDLQRAHRTLFGPGRPTKATKP